MRNLIFCLFFPFLHNKRRLKDGVCKRCQGIISPYQVCTILGELKDKSIPTIFTSELICIACTRLLNFCENGIYVTDQKAVPTLFCPSDVIISFQKFQKDICEKEEKQKRITSIKRIHRGERRRKRKNQSKKHP